MNFKVTVMPSGIIFNAKDGESILDAALRHGISLPYGCRNSVCGACKGKLLEGKINYDGVEPAGLNPAERDAGYSLFCRALPQSDITIESKLLTSTDEIEVRRRPARVEKIEKLSHDVVRLYLKLPESQRMAFFAGQYIDFLLKDGRHRSFSLANSPDADDLIELHIRHVEGGEYTDYIFNTMKEKELVRIEGPHGTFCLNEDSDRPMILMAGGTGFAPIKGIIEHAIAEEITRPIHLYWGVRTQRDLYLESLAVQWHEQGILNYTPVLSEPSDDDNWQGRTGYVHDAIANDFPDITNYDVYMCGPPVMVTAGKDKFIELGLSMEQMFSDSFEFQKS